MKRRQFLKASLAATSVAGLSSALNAAEAQNGNAAREYYELRLYHLRRVLIPHKSIESFATALDRVRSDADYQKAGAEFINAPAADPSYVRVEGSLLVAFEAIPKLEVPVAAKENKPRLFELRTYESHSKKANKKKIEMFNQGEIAIFRRTGLQPVFFGETLIGPRMPNLTYLLVFENMAAREKNWGAFGSDPEWKKLSGTPGYTDAEIVSNISNIFLRPTSYSQI